MPPLRRQKLASFYLPLQREEKKNEKEEKKVTILPMLVGRVGKGGGR
jgi:hypothetical protein